MRFGRLWNRAYAWVSGLGVLPKLLLTLQVKSRQDGRTTQVILGGAAWIKRGRARPVMLTEIPPEQRAPIIKAWSQQASSGRKHLTVSHEAPVSDFAAIGDDHPVFRIDDRARIT